MNGILYGLETTYELSLVALSFAIYAGFAAGLLFVIVLSINLFCRRWLTAGQMSLLWGIVLLRLVVPFGPGSDLSFQNAYISLTETEKFHTVSDQSVKIWQLREVADGAYSTQHEIATAFQSYPSSHKTTWGDILEAVIPLVWLTGFVAILFWTIFSHFRFSRRVRQIPQCQVPRVMNLWAAACQKAGINSKTPVVVVDEMSQPAVMGLFRPRLLLPSETLSITDSQLTMVMLHEAAHLKCWDLAVNWVLLGLRAIHWWNPICWIAATRYVNLREQARDAMVLRWLDNSSEQQYCNLLLKFAEQKSIYRWHVVLPASMIGFVPAWFRKRAVANRLQSMKSSGNRQHWLQIGLVSCVTTFIAFAGLSDAKDPDPVDPGIQWLSHQAISGKIGFVSTSDSSPFVLKVYDLTEAITKVVELEQIPRSEASRNVEALVKQMASFAEQSPPMNSDSTEKSPPQIEMMHQGEQTSVIVNGPQNIHAQLQHMFQAWQQNGIGQIRVEARIVTSKRDAAAMAGLEWNSILMTGRDFSLNSRLNKTQLAANQPTVSASAVIEESVPFMTQILSDAEVRKLIQAAQGDARANVLFAPKVTLFNGQSGEIASSVMRPYVVGIDIGKSGKKEPKLNIINEGMSLAMTSTLSENRQAIQMQTQLGLSEVTDVSTFTYELKGEEVTVQMPTVRRHKFSVEANIPPGQTLVIACPPTNGRKEFFYLLLTPRSLEE